MGVAELKITMVCNEYPPLPHGGIGTFVHTVAHGLAGRGHDMTVVGFGREYAESKDHGVRVVQLEGSGLPYVGNLFSRIRLRRWLSKRAKAKEVDIVEAPEFCGYLPFGVDGCPVVIRLHQSNTAMRIAAGQRPSPGISYYERRTLCRNPNWIGVSRNIVDITKKTFTASPEREAVIYNPVARPPASLPDMPELPEKFILYAGAVTRIKGALVVAEAARELLAKHHDLHLVYVGGIRSDEQDIAGRIAEIVGPGLMDRVLLLGHLGHDKVLACMRRARVFVFPSVLEALGLVVLEAMACGVPVVCTSQPPGPEIIEDGVTGLLAVPTSPSDFREKIALLLDDQGLASRIADNAKSAVFERFSLERCLDETERFYNSMIKGGDRT
jgi:glycosyltransferase involved in cell wall biosynthesis